MLDIDMATSPVAAAFEVVLHTLISRSIQTMRKSTMPRSALAEPLRYAQSARLGRVPMGCGPAYAAVTPPGGNLDPARHFPPQRAKLPDEVSGVQHRDNRVRSTEKPPPAMSLTEARRNQSSVSARSVIVLSRIRRTLVCLARRNAASRRTLHATSLTSDANSGSGSGSMRRMFIKHRAPRSTCTRSTMSSSAWQNGAWYCRRPSSAATPHNTGRIPPGAFHLESSAGGWSKGVRTGSEYGADASTTANDM